MKKIFTLCLVTFLLFGCSKDEADELGSSNKLNPPTWIQGTWLLENESLLGDIGFKFTSNDMIMISDFGEMSFMESAEFSPELMLATIYDEKTASTYDIRMKQSGLDLVLYSFTKVSDTEISWMESPLGIYTKQ